MDESQIGQADDIAGRLSKIEAQLSDLQREVVKSRRTVWRTWFYSEIISPLIAVGVLLGAIYFGVTYIEDRFLGGASIFEEVQKVLKVEQ